jgi:hypothetical protein
MNTYAYVLPETQREAAARLDELFGPPSAAGADEPSAERSGAGPAGMGLE